jgi:hypothetical protein
VTKKRTEKSLRNWGSFPPEGVHGGSQCAKLVRVKKKNSNDWQDWVVIEELKKKEERMERGSMGKNKEKK